jgi:hypothetical protein
VLLPLVVLGTPAVVILGVGSMTVGGHVADVWPPFAGLPVVALVLPARRLFPACVCDRSQSVGLHGVSMNHDASQVMT